MRPVIRAVFGLMGGDERIITAKKILDYIKRHKPQLFKGSDLFNYTSCQSMKEVNPGIGILMERGYIRETARSERGDRSGRPEAMAYEVNPKIFLET